MSALTAGLHGLLVADATLTALLTTYMTEPAVFTVDPVPADAELPADGKGYLVIAGDVTSSPWDTKTSLGRDIRRDIRCYTAAGGSVTKVEAIGERVRALLHRQSFPITGMTVVIAEAFGPVQGPEEEHAYGRIVTVRLRVEE